MVTQSASSTPQVTSPNNLPENYIPKFKMHQEKAAIIVSKNDIQLVQIYMLHVNHIQ